MKHSLTALLMLLAGAVGQISPANGQTTVGPTAVDAEAAYDAIVIGGGAAGLSAAYYLVEGKVARVLVLEKGDRPGGRATQAGYVGKPAGAFKDLTEKLGLQLLQIPSPLDAAICDRHLHWGGDGMALMRIKRSSLAHYNRFVSTVQKAYAAYDEVSDFDKTSPLAPLDNITARQWFRQQGFPDICEREYNVFARGLFGATLDEISALSLIPELGFDYDGDEPIADVDDLENAAEPNEPSGAYTFLHGLSEMTDTLARCLKDRVLLGATVRDVTRSEHGYTVAYQDKGGKQHRLSTRLVILAVPAPAAQQLAAAALPAKQGQILGQVHYAPLVTVVVSSSVPLSKGAYDLAVLDDSIFTHVHDLTWMGRHFQPQSPPRENRLLLQIPAKTSKDESLLAMSDQAITDRALADLIRIAPRAKNHVTSMEVQRLPMAYPVMTVGAHQRLAELEANDTDTLLLAGDYTTYPTLEGALDSGRRAAGHALKALQR